MALSLIHIYAGFFHADPHEGNIIVRDQEIVWIDLGMTGSLNSSQRALVNQAFAAIAAKDPYELKEAALGLTSIKGPVDQGRLLQQMAELLNSYASADLEDINIGEAFMDVIEILRSQNLVINPSFTMLARGFMTIEGVVADLSPTTNIVKIVSDHIQKKTLTLDAMLQKMKEMGIQSARSLDASTKLPTQMCIRDSCR